MVKHLAGSSYACRKQVDTMPTDFLGNIKKVACFFNCENFLITDFSCLSPNENLIIKGDTNNELRISGCNCGYSGEGPRSSIYILQKLGVKDPLLEKVFLTKRAVQFEMINGRVNWDTLDTSMVFTDTLNPDSNLITLNDCVRVDLFRRDAVIFNPQYNCFPAFLRLVLYSRPSQLAYYVGKNSPLYNHYTYKGRHSAIAFQREDHNNICNLDNLLHVNLEIIGERFSIECLIDTKVELRIIDVVYMFLFHHELFDYEIYRKYGHSPQKLFNRKREALHGRFSIPMIDEV